MSWCRRLACRPISEPAGLSRWLGGASFPAGYQVLEVGCGVGAQTVTLASGSPGASSGPAAERRRLHPYDGPEDIAVSLRCITGSVPMMGAGYNNYYQIVQTPEYVAINMEMRHDTRMIPIGDRPHLASNVGQWLGDPRHQG